MILNKYSCIRAITLYVRYNVRTGVFPSFLPNGRWYMPQDPFPLPPGDAEEPDGAALPATEGTGPGDDPDGMGQGLYICAPAEQLTLAGFAQGGEADTMTPGPLLATVVHAVTGQDGTGQDGTGLAGCSDDQLAGILSAGKRMESWAAWIQMAAMREFAARYPGSRPEDEFAADELACELHLTPLSVRERIDFACTVARRLPQTFAALSEGRIHPVHVRIIEDETQFLTPEQAATADAALAEAAPGLTFGELRAAAHKMVLKLDPETAKKQKEAARREAHVRRFREESGNGGMVARELPSDEVLASWQHVEQRALDLRAAGMPGTLQELRVRAYLDLLQERDSRDLPAGPVPADRTADAPDQPAPDNQPTDPPDTGTDPGPDGPGGPGPAPGPGPAAGSGSAPGPGPAAGSGSAPGSGAGSGSAPGAGGGPSGAALINMTVPLATVLGQSETPGEADGYGPLDG